MVTECVNFAKCTKHVKNCIDKMLFHATYQSGSSLKQNKYEDKFNGDHIDRKFHKMIFIYLLEPESERSPHGNSLPPPCTPPLFTTRPLPLKVHMCEIFIVCFNPFLHRSVIKRCQTQCSQHFRKSSQIVVSATAHF
jgi:hypothetical protein